MISSLDSSTRLESGDRKVLKWYLDNGWWGSVSWLAWTQPSIWAQSKLMSSASFTCLESVRKHGLYQPSFFGMILPGEGVSQPVSAQTDHSYLFLNSHCSQTAVLSGCTFCSIWLSHVSLFCSYILGRILKIFFPFQVCRKCFIFCGFLGCLNGYHTNRVVLCLLTTQKMSAQTILLIHILLS